MSIDYRQSGVDIDAGSEAVNKFKDKVKATFSKNVLKDIGSFGAMYDLSEAKEFANPVLVQSVDGVGTKLKVASLAKNYSHIGYDIVNHCCNDIVCQGARPITFLDYVATDRLFPEVVAEIVGSMADACQKAGVSMVGGETAEMPGVYVSGEHDVVGAITGLVEKDQIITGDNISADDVILGLPSSGLHTNGYSLARKLIFEIGKYQVNDTIPELDKNIGETLLMPHLNYSQTILELLEKNIQIKGIAHITGGGFIDNIPRILPKGLAASIRQNSWPILPIFQVMQKLGEVKEKEMYRTFNMGIGLVFITSQEEAKKTKQYLEKLKSYAVYEIGRVVPGQGVELVNK